MNISTWDKKRNLEAEMLESIDHIENGQYQKLNTNSVDAYAATVRLKLGVSQRQFAEMLCVSIRTIQEWEQNRRNPTGAALALLRIVESEPEIVRGILTKNG